METITMQEIFADIGPEELNAARKILYEGCPPPRVRTGSTSTSALQRSHRPHFLKEDGTEDVGTPTLGEVFQRQLGHGESRGEFLDTFPKDTELHRKRIEYGRMKRHLAQCPHDKEARYDAAMMQVEIRKMEGRG